MADTALTCEKCGHTYTTKYSLARHLTSSKKCSEKKIAMLYKCPHRCGYQTDIKCNMGRHVKICKKAKVKTGKMSKIKHDTIEALTDDLIARKVEDYTREDYLAGERGVTRIILSIITLEDERNYVCTDISRRVFMRLSESGTWERDVDMYWINKIIDKIHERHSLWYSEIYTGLFEEMCKYETSPDMRSKDIAKMDDERERIMYKIERCKIVQMGAKPSLTPLWISSERETLLKLVFGILRSKVSMH